MIEMKEIFIGEEAPTAILAIRKHSNIKDEILLRKKTSKCSYRLISFDISVWLERILNLI